jgi:hypothetical protein
MYIWEKSRKKLQILSIFVIIISPIAFISGYALKISNIISDLVEQPLTYEPDPTQFMDINYTRLAEMVEWTDKRFESHHIALNMSTDTNFVDDGTFDHISNYTFSDNQALQGGYAVTAYTFKYLAGKRENNTLIQNDALRVLRNLTYGFSMFLRVPNGGLGPEFPGILARGYAPPDPDGIGSYYFQGHPKEANGTGDYSDWKWRGFTSNDEHSGFYIALAVLLKYANDDPFIANLTHLMIEQIANYMVQTNFIGFQQFGGPSGIEQKPRALSSGFWVACLLKMASIVNPVRYEPIYYHWLSSEGVAISGRISLSFNQISDYFAYLLDYGPVFAFFILEDPQTPVWKQLYQSYLESLWSYVKTNRNAYFNALHLGILATVGQAQRGYFPIMEHDLEDQLMRLEINHFPDRLNPKPAVPEHFELSQEMIQAKKYLIEDPIGRQFSGLFENVDYKQVWYKEPLSVEYRPAHTFIWELSPYWQEVRAENALCETAGLTLTTPYWIARAYGYILPEGIKLNAF